MPTYDKIPALENKFESTRRGTGGIYFEDVTSIYPLSKSVRPKKGKNGTTYNSYYFNRENTKNKIEPSTYKNSQIKFLPEYLLTNMITTFYKNKVFIFFLTEEPTGFLIENKETFEGFLTYFNAMWRIAKGGKK